MGSEWSGSNPELPLPSLLALDLAVAAVDDGMHEGERFLLVAPGPMVAEQVARRLAAPPRVRIETAASDEEGAPRELAGGRREPGAQRALWVAPRRSTWGTTARELDASLAPGALLAVVGNGPLAGPLSLVRPASAGLSLGTAQLEQVAMFLRYPTVGRWWLYGLRSAGCGLLRLLADRFRRPDLADRAEAAFQVNLVEKRRPTAWCIGIWIGRKPRR